MPLTSLPSVLNYLQRKEIMLVCLLCNFNTKLLSFLFCLSSLLATEPGVVAQNTKHAEGAESEGEWLIILVTQAPS